MRAVSPVLKGVPEVVMGKDQPQYIPLPAIKSRSKGIVTTKWKFSWKERLMVLFVGSVYLQVWVFNNRLQPVKMFVNKPDLKEVV